MPIFFSIDEKNRVLMISIILIHVICQKINICLLQSHICSRIFLVSAIKNLKKLNIIFCCNFERERECVEYLIWMFIYLLIIKQIVQPCNFQNFSSTYKNSPIFERIKLKVYTTRVFVSFVLLFSYAHSTGDNCTELLLMK